MKEEIRIFFTAIMFYTRIRVPSWVDHSPEYISKSTRYFPLIGWIVGAFSFFWLFAGYYLLGFATAVVLSMVASVWITGAFHEDGFADVCDGFGGGWTREKILEIMKDSCIGTFGTVGLILILLLKFVMIFEILESMDEDVWMILFFMISLHSVSRLNASLLIPLLDYVQETGLSKVKPVSTSFGGFSMVIAAIFGLTPLALFIYLIGSWWFMAALVPLLLLLVWMRSYFKKWIGGYTGDCLGALQQVSEIVFLAALIGIWRFI